MPAVESHLISTAWGPFRLSWSERGLARTRLPDRQDLGAPVALASLPLPVAEWARMICAYFDGGQPPLGTIPLDEEGVSEAERRIYQALRAVPRGETVTYGELARRAALPGEARAVGGAMARNPWPLIVPCHRVLAANGKPGGFSAPGGLETKLRMLTLESAAVDGTGTPLLPGLF